MDGNRDYGQLRCLIVDDFEMIRTMIKEALTGLGVTRIDEATDGVIALAAVMKSVDIGQPYDVVFSDWNMPNMNGIDFLKACKKDPRLKSIPIIMVTSEGEKNTILEALKSGAFDYIVKPFASDTILKKLDKISQKKQAL